MRQGTLVPEAQDVRIELEQLAERRRKVTEERQTVSAEMRAAVRRARDEGLAMAEIIRLSGISKQGIHHLLNTPS